MALLGPQADDLLAKLPPDSTHTSLQSLFSCLKDFWLQDTYVKLLSMHEFQLSTGCTVRSFIFEMSEVWETLDMFDVAAIGTLWKGILVTTTAHLGDEIVQALLNSQVLGILCLSQKLGTLTEGAVSLFREFYKQLRIGSSLQYSLHQAELAQPEVAGAFKLILP